MFILGIIPARGGSQGIIDKNIQEINGKTLIQYAVDSAEGAIDVNDYFVYTDKYVEYRTLGIKRPRNFSKGQQGSVVEWLPDAIEQYTLVTGNVPDTIVFLQPTSPMRTAEDVDKAIEQYIETHEPCLVSVTKAPALKKYYNYKKVALVPQSPYDRHADKDIYVRNSAIFIFAVDFLYKNKAIFDENPALYVMPKNRSFDIDTMEDLEMVRKLMKEE